MATRQYIGARYVPKFYINAVDGSSLWQDNVIYEPLTWVTRPNYRMYISRKTVPATVGAPEDNIEYWLQVGEFNGYITELQEKIDALASTPDGRVTVLENSVSNIETELTQTQSDATEAKTTATQAAADIVTINETLSTATQNIATLQDEVEELTEHVYFCLGDSYTAGVGGANSYWYYCGQYLGLDSSHWLSTSAIGLGLGDGSWLSNLQTYVANNPNVVPTITDFFIMGGFNDAGYTTSALITAFGTLLDYITTTFTNVKNIYVSCFGWSAASNDIRKGIANSVRPAYENMVLSKGVIYINDLDYVFHNYAFFSDDNVHPNDNGMRACGRLLANFIKKGYCKPCTARTALNCSWTGMLPASDAIFARQDGANVLIECDYSVVWTAYTDISGLVAVATINNRTGCVLGTGYTEVPVSINNTPCKLVFSNQTLFIRCPSGFSVANGGTFTMSGTAMLPCNIT